MKPCIVARTYYLAPPVEVPKHFTAKLRRADDFIKLGVAATAQVFPEPDEQQTPDHRTGLFVGTAFGPMQTNFDVLGLIVDEDQTSPTLFSHSVFNSAAGYIARLFNIPGSCFTFTDFNWPFFLALAEGYQAISSGRLEHCLVLQVENYSDLLLDARTRTGASTDEWHPGAVAWYLSSTAKSTGWQLEDVNVACKPAASVNLIHRQEELVIGQETILCTTPLAAAASVTRLIQEKNENEHTSRLTAPYGSVSLTFTPVIA